MLYNDINVLNGNTLQMDHVHLSIPIFKTILGWMIETHNN